MLQAEQRLAAEQSPWLSSMEMLPCIIPISLENSARGGNATGGQAKGGDSGDGGAGGDGGNAKGGVAVAAGLSAEGSSASGVAVGIGVNTARNGETEETQIKAAPPAVEWQQAAVQSSMCKPEEIDA